MQSHLMTVVVLMVRASQLSSAGGRGSRRRADAIGVPESPVQVKFVELSFIPRSGLDPSLPVGVQNRRR